MQIQYLSRYLNLAKEGLVEDINCPIDQGLLFPNIDNDDSLFLYCLSCSYKKTIGTKMYEDIKNKVIQYESGIIKETDHVGREKFWEDLGRP